MAVPPSPPGPEPLPPGAGDVPYDVAYDVVVVGAGAAGLWAAGTCAARGRRTLLLEKNRRPGVKILASGGGRCNVTTTLPPKGVRDAFGVEGGRFLAPALRALTPLDLRAELLRWGVPTHEAPLEKVFPDSQKARDVADALTRRAEAAGAAIRCGTAVVGIERRDGGFVVRTREGDVPAPRAIVAVGGESYPKTGTTGDGYAWMEALGLRLVRRVPALVPLVVDLPWVRALAGVHVQDARVVVVATADVGRVLAPGSGTVRRVLADRRRPLLFTHTGLSGPGPMDVSRWFEVLAPWHRPSLHVDFAPALSEDAVRAALLAAIAAGPAAPVSRALPAFLPERLAASLCGHAGVPPSRRAGETSKAERHALVQVVKRCEVPVAGTRGYDFAEVTAGGVALDEVDPGTMEVRRAPGLFLCGEILDLDGPIGGFNFQAAFSTAEVAGRHA